MAERQDEKRVVSTAAELARYAGFGVQLVATLALFGVAGWWIDGRLSTGPWLLILGLLIGAALSFVSLLRAVPRSRGSRKPPPEKS